MSKIPRSAEVDKALKATVRAVEKALDALNGQAGKLMSRGQYEKAESLAQTGREVMTFVQEVEALRTRWRALCRGPQAERKAKNEKTPLWTYYQPILRALEALGGEAKREPLMAEVEKLMAADFKASDRDPLSGGKFQRWQVMVLRARKHMVQEGWIESGGGFSWRITNAGRRAAKADVAKTKKSE